MTELSRLLAVAGPALILVLAVAGLRDKWGHSLIRPALWLTAWTAGFFTIYRTAVFFISDAPRGTWQFEFIVIMNNVSLFILSLVVAVFLVGAWKWKQLGYPYQVTEIGKRRVRR